MNGQDVIAATSDILGVRANTTEQRATLLLVRTGSEVLSLIEQPAEPATLILGWLRVLDDSAGAPLVENLVREGRAPSRRWVAEAYAREPGLGAHLPNDILALAALLLVPADRRAAEPVWEFIDELLAAIELGTESLAELRGWLRSEASSDVTARVEALLDARAAKGACARKVVIDAREARARGQVSARASFDSTFDRARTDVGQQLANVLAHATTFGLDRSGIERLAESVASERFRVGVIGEFKRGKSTLIGALVGRPGLLPADVLPSTSALIELRWGETEAFFTRTNRAPYEYVPAAPDAFRSSAGAAAERQSQRDAAAEAAAAIPRWRVTTPSAFLASAGIEVVDTPGLGEDYARDVIAREEASRADAAVLVFNATQLASQQELDLVGEMEAKLENLIIAVNRADDVPLADWPRLRAHVVNRLAQRGLSVPQDRVMMVSALKAEEGLRAGARSIWLERMGELRTLIEQHLFARSGPAKAKALCARVRRLVAQSRSKLQGQVESRRRQLEDLDSLEAHIATAAREHDEALRSIEQATALLGASGGGDVLAGAFFDALPKILDEVGRTQGTWKSDKNPITSPKQHVTEVAAAAQKELVRSVERWAKADAGKVVSALVAARLEQAAKQLEGLREYLKDAGAGSPDELIEQLQREALSDAFGGSIVEADATGTAMKAAITGALSLVIGYIVADIILYYVLGVISGFLNPFLLAAAVVGGVAAYLIKGKDFVIGWIRSNVRKELEKGLQSIDTRKTLERAFERSMQEVFTRLAASFRGSTGALVGEMRYQQKKFEADLQEKRATLGSPEAVRAEVAELEARAAQVSGALDALEDAAARIEKELLS